MKRPEPMPRLACCEPLEHRRLLSFTPAAESFPGGANPVTGDFNRDGRVDLAFVDSVVRVLRGDGDGTFQPALISAEGHVGPSPQSVAVGDFNADGKLDLAAATYDYGGQDNAVRILLGHGDGTFAAAAPVAIGAGYSSNYVATGHLDGDGNLDLVVTSDDLYGFAGQGVSVWLGGGDGTFAWAAGYGVSDSNPIGDGPISAWAPVVADFDGDGDGDVAVAVSSSADGGVAKVYLGNGNGTLQPPRDAVVFPNAFYYHFFSVLAGNFGGNARPDLVAGGVVLLSNGDGTFRKAGAIGAFTDSAGDVNGDGRLDLVAASGGNVNVYLGKGDGTFAPPIATTTGASYVNFVVLADLNADGRPDAVVSNGDTGAVSAMLNDGVWPGSTPPKTFVGPGGAGSGGNWSNSANWTPSGVPTAGDHVSIAGKTVNLAANATVSSLTLTGGATLNVSVNGNRVVRTSGLSIGSDAKVNLNDNDLIIDYSGSAAASPIGSWNGSAYTGVTGLIARGYNFSAWDGTGLVTTMADARNGLTTLAPAEAAHVLGITGNQTATWNGQTIDTTTVIVKYTYAGDLNLDGRVDAQDYGIIDNWVQFPGANGYANGDINYDGVIDAVDYGIIDNTIQLQGPPISPASTAAADEPVMRAYLPLRLTHANHDPVDREEVEASLVAVAMDATSR